MPPVSFEDAIDKAVAQNTNAIKKYNWCVRIFDFTPQKGYCLKTVGGVMSELNTSSRNWSIFCHLSSFFGFILPLGNIVAPLLIWLLKRKDIPSLDAVGKEVLNFNISMLIYFAVSTLLVFAYVGMIFLVIFGFMFVILPILGAIKASEGKPYTYPMIFRFVK